MAMSSPTSATFVDSQSASSIGWRLSQLKNESCTTSWGGGMKNFGLPRIFSIPTKAMKYQKPMNSANTRNGPTLSSTRLAVDRGLRGCPTMVARLAAARRGRPGRSTGRRRRVGVDLLHAGAAVDAHA